MKQHILEAKTYITEHKSEFIIGVSILLGAATVIAIIVFSVQASTPKVVFQPTRACELLTAVEAKQLLGDKMIASGKKDPVVSRDMATSSCGYTDGNPDTDNMTVAAIIVRAAVNENGVQQNRTDFDNGMPRKDVKVVNDLGDSAYFNQRNGQLNILNGRDWIILSYGPGSAPASNTIDQALQLADKVVSKVSRF